MSKNKDYIESIDNAERRYQGTPAKIEKKAGEESKFSVIEGYAAVFNKRADLYFFEEEFLPDAFDDVLTDDVRCLFNHNADKVLARSSEGKGTLTLSVDKKGLKYSYVTPDRTFAVDLQDMIEKGDISQSSFAFKASEVIWHDASDEDEKELRQIKKVSRIFDVSPVTFPAYAETEVGKRSYEQHKEQRKKDTEDDASAKNENRALSRFEAQLIVNQNPKK